MRVSRLLAAPVLFTLATGISAQAPVKSAAPVLELLPAQVQVVVCYPDVKRLEAKWSQVVGPFGGKDAFLMLKPQTGIDPLRLGPGPCLRVSLRPSGAGETWVWLVPAKDPKAVLKGLKPKGTGGVWTWEGPAAAPKAKGKAPVKAAPTVWFGTAKAGYLVVADSEASLAAFQQPAGTLASELAPYAAGLQQHDVSVVATKAAVQEAAQAAGQAFKHPAKDAKEDGKPEVPAAKVAGRLQAKLDHWADLARTSVHHVLGSLDISGDGGLTFGVRALLSPGSPLGGELAALPPVAGHPLKGLATSDFALALGGEWSGLVDLQSAFLEALDPGGKVQPATLARLQKAMEAQNGLARSVAGTFSAPVPRGSLLSGMTSLLRVSDSKAYLAATEETSQAQNTFFQELGMDAAVTFSRDILPGVPSCGVTTRLSQKGDDPAAASSRMALAMIFGGDAIQMSMGALDDHQVLAVLGGPELLKARMEMLKKAPDGLAPSILAVEPDLGRDHRFVLYLDPRGLRDFAQVVAGMFKGGSAEVNLPALPEVPAAGLTLALDPSAIELRGSVRADTLKATATLIKAIGALFPANQKGPVTPQ
jgi:hypothetical protein